MDEIGTCITSKPRNRKPLVQWSAARQHYPTYLPPIQPQSPMCCIAVLHQVKISDFISEVIFFPDQSTVSLSTCDTQNEYPEKAPSSKLHAMIMPEMNETSFLGTSFF